MGTDDDEYYQYWNDINNEKEKEWWITGDDYHRVELYLQKIGVVHQLSDSLVPLKNKINGTIVDIAAGTCWSVPYLLKAGFNHVICIDYSYHRIQVMGPQLCSHYHVDPDAVTFVWGSFYNMKLSNNSVDAVLISQALHHADKPEELLYECMRVLKDDGVIIVIGEPVMSILSEIYLRIKGKIVSKNQENQALCRDPLKGDHSYSRSYYDLLFSSIGLKIKKHYYRKSKNYSYLLTKRGPPR